MYSLVYLLEVPYMNQYQQEQSFTSREGLFCQGLIFNFLGLIFNFQENDGSSKCYTLMLTSIWWYETDL